MNWRLASRLSVIILVVLVVALVLLLGTRTNSPNLQGTDLGSTPAPDFHLTDQSDVPIALSQFKGKPVVLTFLYTHCRDVCPLVAEKLHTVMQNLGSDAQRVGVLAVSTDPKGDTPQAAVNFSKIHGMQNYWHYLIGTHNALAPVWSAYNVDAEPADSSGSVTHTSAIYVIDKQGRERVFFGDDFTPDELTADLKILLGE